MRKLEDMSAFLPPSHSHFVFLHLLALNGCLAPAANPGSKAGTAWFKGGGGVVCLQHNTAQSSFGSLLLPLGSHVLAIELVGGAEKNVIVLRSWQCVSSSSNPVAMNNPVVVVFFETQLKSM